MRRRTICAQLSGMLGHEVRSPEKGRIISAYSDSNPKMGADNYRPGHRLTPIRCIYGCCSICRSSHQNGSFLPMHQGDHSRLVRSAFRGQHFSTTWHAFSYHIRSQSKVHQPFLEIIFPDSQNGSAIAHCVPSTDGWLERGYYMRSQELPVTICRSPSSHLE